MVRKRIQQDCFYYTEESCVCADAQRQSQNRNGGESRIPPESARCETQILKECFQEWKPATIAMAFFGLFETAEFDERVASRFFAVHASAEVVFDMHLEMVFQLRGKLAVAALRSKRRVEPHEPCSQPSHNASCDLPPRSAIFRLMAAKIIRNAAPPWDRRGQPFARAGKTPAKRRRKSWRELTDRPSLRSRENQ